MIMQSSGEVVVADAIQHAQAEMVWGTPPQSVSASSHKSKQGAPINYDSEIRRLKEQIDEMVPKDELDKARQEMEMLNADWDELEKAYEELEGDNIKLTDGMDELKNELSRIQQAAAVITP